MSTRKRQSRQNNVDGAVAFFKNAKTKQPFKGKGNEELLSALELIESTAQTSGLSAEHIDALLDVALDGIQVETVCKRLLKSLIPSGSVLQNSAVKCISALCVQKHSITLQCLLLRWLLVVYDYLEGRDHLHCLYDTIFHFLHYRTLMPYVCHLLYLLTRKEDIRLFRVRHLLQYQKDMGTQPYLTGLLSIYRRYYPNIIHVVNTRSYKSFFPTYDRKWSAVVRQVQEKNRQPGAETNWEVALLQRNSTGTQANDLVPSRKRRKMDPIPLIDSLTTKSCYKRDRQGNILGLKTVPFVLVQCFKDLLDNIDSLEFPSQIGAVLKSDALKHMMSYTKNLTAATRFEFWMSETLYEELTLTDKEKYHDRVSNLLKLLKLFGDFLREGTPTVDLVLSQYLQKWNGLDYAPHIFKLISQFRLVSFDALNIAVLEPLQKLFACSTVYFKCKVIVCLTELLRNQAAYEWPRYRESPQGNRILSLFCVEEETFSHRETLTQFVSWVCRLSLAGSIEEKFHPLYELCVLDFLELVSSLHTHYDLPFVVFVEPRLYERLVISHNPITVAKLCEVICRYKESFSMLKSRVPSTLEDQQMIRRCNHIIRTFCNLLWRFQAYSTDDKASIFHINPATVDERLGGQAMGESLSVIRHPALLPFTVRYVHKCLMEDTIDVYDLKFLKRDLLTHLDEYHLDAFSQFVSTFVRSRPSQTGNPHKTQMSSLSAGDSQAFGF
ncbi:centromere protein I-like [Mya arenaria]|uniref:centromere protein I-like n=1 Tax=Mya arenaria TaxID=6604 RepID=UPI0022E10FE5|nr:centromere protein I-like [Mya arenaria]XP_052782660.1 centromere protein I-like [Mya arenaria]